MCVRCGVFMYPGSILISCAYLGGHVLGSDIDWNMVHGKGNTVFATPYLQGYKSQPKICLIHTAVMVFLHVNH